MQKKDISFAYVLFKVTTRFELVIRELQSLALPLGYVTKTMTPTGIEPVLPP